jgi:DNA repair protein RadC
MRTRLLARPSALADYEILEMLLFLGIPRRDTKPQAKGLINRFGSLAGTLSAPAAALADAALPPRVIEVFEIVTEAAAALARSEPLDRVTLSDWDALDRFLDPPTRSIRPPGLSALLLNNRNQLLIEVRLEDGNPTQQLLRHALARHATAAILVRNLADAAPSASKADRALLQAIQAAAAPLLVQVHDMAVVGQGAWISLRTGAR